MNKQRATRSDARQHDALSKERLEEWLDSALADTFPASDPVASPPAGALGEGNDLPATIQSEAGRSRVYDRND
jgi:hypothetical protein